MSQAFIASVTCHSPRVSFVARRLGRLFIDAPIKSITGETLSLYTTKQDILELLSEYGSESVK